MLSVLLAAIAVSCTNSSLSSTDPSPSKCQISVTPTTTTANAAGGTVRIDIAAQQECDWSAASEAAWITGVAPAAGQGNSPVTMQVAANGLPTVRRGNVKVAGVTVVVTQDAASCQYALTPPSRSIGASGGATTFDLTTMAGCGWTAATDSAWIHIANGNGTGSGSATINVSVDENSAAARAGGVTAGGQTVTIAQAGVTAANCTFAVAPISATSPAAGGAGSLTLTTSTTCGWAATTTATWITIADGAKSGIGTATVGYTVAANTTTSPRTGTIVVGGQTVTVTQASASAPACAYDINSAAQTVPASAGAGAPVVLTTAAGCAWTAVSGASWITVSSAASGTGPATVTFNVGINPGAQRSGIITIGGRIHTVTQSAVLTPQCSYALNPTSQNVGAAAATGLSVAVTAASGCAWTAATNTSWLTISSGASGSGNGSVIYSAATNTGAARQGTLTIAEKTFTVTQAQSCTFSINPTTRTVGKGSGTGTIAVTATSGCTWTASTATPWMAITAGASGTGNGSTGYSFQMNNGNGDRVGTITIAGTTFTLTQRD